MMRNLVAVALAASAWATTLAYRDSAGRLIYRREDAPPKVVAAKQGYESCLRRDGKMLLYTREDVEGPRRTMVLYDGETGKSKDVIAGLVRDPHWSDDGTQIAFLKFDAGVWQVWQMPAVEPGKAARVGTQSIMTVVGWAHDNSSIICFDDKNLYWMGVDGKIKKSLALSEIYGDQSQWMSSDHLRLHPQNPDLLVLSAYYNETPKGAPVDAMDLTSTVALYDLKTRRRTVILPIKFWGHDAEWSADGVWIYFTRLEGRQTYSVWRMHADGGGLERVVGGSQPAVAE